MQPFSQTALWWPDPQQGIAESYRVVRSGGRAVEMRSRSLGLSGMRQGILVAELESAGLWPLTVLVDRYHPTVRSGEWSPVFRDPRAFCHSMLGHLVFGATLGALTSSAGPRR